MGSSNKQGFTLIEMIIAISLLALVAILGWRSLDAMVRTRFALDERMAETHDMQLTFAQLQFDCAQLAPQTLMVNRPALKLDPNRLLLVRLLETEEQPTQLQVVSYVLREGVLTRTVSKPTRDMQTLDSLWQVALEGGNATPPVVLQSGIAAMNMRLWAANAQGWQPATADPAAAPTGLELTLNRSGQTGSAVKYFLLGAV